MDWGRATKPVAKGSNVAALAAAPDGVGYAVDTSGNAFRTSQQEGWTDIGILDAQLRLYDVWAGANQRVYVTAIDGNVYRYDDSAGDWSPIGVADGIALRAVDVRIDDGEGEMVVVGGDGCIYERTGRERWRELPSPQQTTLFDVTVGEEADVLVGKNGTVIERPPSHDTAGRRRTPRCTPAGARTTTNRPTNGERAAQRTVPETPRARPTDTSTTRNSSRYSPENSPSTSSQPRPATESKRSKKPYSLSHVTSTPTRSESVVPSSTGQVIDRRQTSQDSYATAAQDGA